VADEANPRFVHWPPPFFTALERELVRFATPGGRGDSVFQHDLEFALAAVADAAFGPLAALSFWHAFPPRPPNAGMEQRSRSVEIPVGFALMRLDEERPKEKPRGPSSAWYRPVLAMFLPLCNAAASRAYYRGVSGSRRSGTTGRPTVRLDAVGLLSTRHLAGKCTALDHSRRRSARMISPGFEICASKPTTGRTKLSYEEASEAASVAERFVCASLRREPHDRRSARFGRRGFATSWTDGPGALGRKHGT